MSDAIRTLADWIGRSRRAVVLTGAGASTESGIPDFRSSSGLWREASLEEVGTVQGFVEDPVRFYRFWQRQLGPLEHAVPNVTHRLVAELERRGHVHAVVTQNIDGLHEKAGSSRVFEVHGTFRRAHCVRCRSEATLEEIFASVARAERPHCHCGGLLKPDVVLFGDPLPPCFEEAAADVEGADLLLVLGSSLEVYPVADLVPRARRQGVPVVLVNRERGPFDDEGDLVVHATLGPTMQGLASLLGIAI